jgi:hypothetical protein
MDCIYMTELSEFALMAYLEGEASQDVITHLEQCPHCAQKLKVLAGEQALLKTKLFRSTCPTPLELGEYQLDNLPQQERLAIARHIRDCPYCRAEVRQLEGYLKDLAFALDAPNISQTHPIRVLVARLLSGGGTGAAQQPATASVWAGVRGSETEAQIYQADEVLITIEVQEDPRDPARKVLLGLIIGTEPIELEAHLWQQDQHVGSSTVEESGNFTLPGVEPGRFELSLRGRNMMVKIEDLEVF